MQLGLLGFFLFVLRMNFCVQVVQFKYQLFHFFYFARRFELICKIQLFLQQYVCIDKMPIVQSSGRQRPL